MEIENVKVGSNDIEKIVTGVKKTKNTSVKNLTVNVIHEDGTDTMTIKNMYQVWNFIRGHYSDDKNLADKITVYQDNMLLKEIHAEKKTSGKVWMVDKMQIGKHVKND